jgi:hypothetical protein
LRQSAPLSLDVTLFGGAIEVDGLRFTSSHQALPSLEVGREYLLLLKQDHGKWYIAGRYYGAFRIDDDVLMPVTGKQGFGDEVRGIRSEDGVAQETVELQPGDLLALFTDGVTEAEDASGEQFGDERLADLLMEHKDEPLEEVVQIVTGRVRAWAHDPDNADDTTILLARRV